MDCFVVGLSSAWLATVLLKINKDVCKLIFSVYFQTKNIGTLCFDAVLSL